MKTRPGLSFSHIGIFVCDQPMMEAFYTRVLEFTVTDRGQLSRPDGTVVDLVFLSRDPDEHHQIVLATGRPASLPFNVINQISLRADSVDTLKTFYRRLHDEQADEIRAITHGNAISVYARDPEGNRLEIFWDTPWYVTQPHVVPVDMTVPNDALLRAVEAHARSLPGFEPWTSWRARMAARMGVD